MKKKKAFIYVGHSNWGKSYALKQITFGSSHKKTILIQDIWFWVRKMSNDDADVGLLEFAKTIPHQWYEHFILAYCPNHVHEDDIANEILAELQESCELFFFVQEEKYSGPRQLIPESEISRLREIGKVEVLQGKVEDVERAEKFMDFIEKNLR